MENCSNLENYILAIVFLPYWFRLAQCFRRYHDCKLKVHLINAGKYFSMILIHFSNIFKYKIQGDTTYWTFIVMSIISTIYAYSWDLYMDWGLLRSTACGKMFLRPKLLLPIWFYYYAIVSNLFLRFAWILIYFKFLPDWLHSTQILAITICVGEGFRRAQWSLIRLENEQVNNFEKYRTFLDRPSVKED